MIHAAIDPTIERGVVAICEREDRRHTVLRFDFDRLVCETWFDPDSAPTLVPTYLAVGRQVE